MKYDLQKTVRHWRGRKAEDEVGCNSYWPREQKEKRIIMLRYLSNPFSLPSMNLLRPSSSALDIQNHLYTSFLEGSTADVALRVHGSWHVIYNLHRVVLIQSVCVV